MIDLTKFNPVTDGLQLSAAKRLDKESTVTMLFKAIKDLVDYIEPKKGLNDDQIFDSVEWILEDYWNVKIEEVLLVLTEMKKSGQYYERLKHPEIKERLDNYFKSEERAKRVEAYHKRFKTMETDQKTSIVDYEAYKKRLAVKKMSNTEKREKYIEWICEQLGVTFDQIKSKSRIRDIADARHLCQYYEYNELKYSLTFISKNWDCDHTTVISAIKKVDDLKSFDKKFQDLLDNPPF